MSTDNPLRPLAYESQQPPLSRVDFVVVALRLLGIYHLTLSLQVLNLASVFSQRLPGVTTWQKWPLLMPYTAWAVVGILLLTRTRWFAVRILPGTSTGEPLQLHSSGKEFQAMAFSVVGIWIALSSVFEIAGPLVQPLFYPSDAPESVWPKLIPGGLECLAGIALFLQARGLAYFWHRIRTGGVRVNPQ